MAHGTASINLKLLELVIGPLDVLLKSDLIQTPSITDHGVRIAIQRTRTR